MGILALKLTLTPAVIAATTLAARRFGPSIGGWLIGLPVTAGPVVLVLALEHGSRFAGHVAVGLVGGVTTTAAFTTGYAAACRLRAPWWGALAAGSAAFAAAAAVVVASGLGLAVMSVCALAALAAGLAFIPSGGVVTPASPSRYDLPVRMVIATTVLLLVTGFAQTLGPRLSGLLLLYPLLSTTLAVFVHRSDGPRAALAVYRGLLLGLFAFTGFAFTLALVLTRVSLADAYAIAIAMTLAIQLGSLRAIRRA